MVRTPIVNATSKHYKFVVAKPLVIDYMTTYNFNALKILRNTYIFDQILIFDERMALIQVVGCQ